MSFSDRNLDIIIRDEQEKAAALVKRNKEQGFSCDKCCHGFTLPTATHTRCTKKVKLVPRKATCQFFDQAKEQ